MGRKAAARRLSRTQDPTKGQFNFLTTPFALTSGQQVASRFQQPERMSIQSLALG